MTGRQESKQSASQVLNELQDHHEKFSLENRSHRLMTELTALCQDRDQVLTTESLHYLNSIGKIEHVKLIPEKNSSNLSTERSTDKKQKEKHDDRSSADAARRQRVEELTRFFMEAKSDIEFALGGNSSRERLLGSNNANTKDSKESGEDTHHSDKEDDNIDEDKDSSMTDDVKKDDREIDPTQLAYDQHMSLLNMKLDTRVLNPLLVTLRETDPLFYGAVICHPLLTGQDSPSTAKLRNEKNRPVKLGSSTSSNNSNNQAKKNKRKDRFQNSDRTKDKAPGSNSSNAPDISQPKLNASDSILQLSCFLAKVFDENSIQSNILAIKVLLDVLFHPEYQHLSESGSNISLLLPLLSHLKVFNGGPQPVSPCNKRNKKKHNKGKSVSTKSSSKGSSSSKASQRELTTDFMRNVLEFDGDLSSLSALRERFQGTYQNDEDDEDESSAEPRDFNSSTSTSSHILHQDEDDEHFLGDPNSMNENHNMVDEEALMARAIALSLSPELNLRSTSSNSADTGGNGESKNGDSCDPSRDQKESDSLNVHASDQTAVSAANIQLEIPQEASSPTIAVVDTKFPYFSSEEMSNMFPSYVNDLEKSEGSTDNMVSIFTILQSLMVQSYVKCEKYLRASQSGVLISNHGIAPNPLTFLIINSILHDFKVHFPLSIANCCQEARLKWDMYHASSVFILLHLLETFFFHIDVMQISPASVGLGQALLKYTLEKDNLSQVYSANLLIVHLKDILSFYMEAQPRSGAGHNCTTLNRYENRIYEQSLMTWGRSLPYFYPLQSDRVQLLTELFRVCDQNRQVAANTMHLGEESDIIPRRPELTFFHQLEITCTRFALPDVMNQFVPCFNSAPSSKQIVNFDTSTTNPQTVDDLLFANSLKNLQSNNNNNKHKVLYSPTCIERSIQQRTLPIGMVYDFISEHACLSLLEAYSLHTPVVFPDSELVPNSTVSNICKVYEEMYAMDARMEEETLESLHQLPVIINNLKTWCLDLNFPKAPIGVKNHFPIFSSDIQKGKEEIFFESASDSKHNVSNVDIVTFVVLGKDMVGALDNGRVKFLRSFQDVMFTSLSFNPLEDSIPLEFDSNRCADTMTLCDKNQIAKQHTAKQWGMVMTTRGCAPNTGIHEWAVKLDRCEKGHVFLGVCTRDASVSTYVGGDRQGWGLIGTRALWHNRSKVRGDYGDGFSTGSIIRVRLNTDTGALSFGINDWDWGVAFDGLTQHGMLYPAIGLYQRDDQVTILPVRLRDTNDSAGSNGMSSNTSVEKPYPNSSHHLDNIGVPIMLKYCFYYMKSIIASCCEYLSAPEIQHHLAVLCNNNTENRNTEVSAELEGSYKALKHQLASHPFVSTLLFPMLSSLTLLHTNMSSSTTPTSSAKIVLRIGCMIAIEMIPYCSTLVKHIDEVNVAIANYHQLKPFEAGLRLHIDGEWELKSMAAGSIPAQQYQLHITQSSENSVLVTGQSTGNYTSVSLNGTLQGTKVRFLETWRQGGTCLVDGRLRGDGKIFHGTYEDTKSHTNGQIVGSFIKPVQKESKNSLMLDVQNFLILLEMTGCLCIGAYNSSLLRGDEEDYFLQLHHNCNSTQSAAKQNLENADLNNVTNAGNAEANSSDLNYDGIVNSFLLSGGFPNAMVEQHILNIYAKYHEVIHLQPNGKPVPDLSAPQEFSVMNESADEWRHYVLPSHLIQKGLYNDPMQKAPTGSKIISPPTSPNNCATPLVHSGNALPKLESAFLIDFIQCQNTNSVAYVIDKYVLKHVGESPFLRLGGEPMKMARRAICATMLYHTGLDMHIHQYFHTALETDSRPNDSFLHIWRASQRVIEWGIRMKNSSGVTYSIAADLIIQRAYFLLSILPNQKAIYAARCSVSNSNTSTLSPSGNNTAEASESADRLFSQTLMEIARFIEMNVDLNILNYEILKCCSRAFLKRIGMLSLRYILSENKCLVDRTSVYRIKGLQISSAVSCILQNLSPSLYSDTSSNATVMLSDDSAISSTTFYSQASVNHYTSKLGGCGQHLKQQVQDAFECLYTYLASLLSKATWSHDYDLQLVLLQCWGLFILPEDHVFLSKVGIFRILQTVLDESRTNMQQYSKQEYISAGVSARNPLHARLQHANTDQLVLLLEHDKKIIQTALKIVHLLAAQVANTNEPTITNNTSLDPIIPLIRQPSGPETLGKSVFNMLHTELRNALQDLQFMKLKNMSTSSMLHHSVQEAHQYCFQICNLLYSVSGAAICRTYLTSSRWLKLFITLVKIGTSSIQRRVLKLLRRLIPFLDPVAISVDFLSHSIDDDGDDDDEVLRSDNRDNSTCAISFLKFCVGVVGDIAPTDHTLNSKRQMLVQESSNILIQEVVLLLRSLYNTPKWAVLLNEVVAQALQSISQINFQDKSTTGSDMEDVDMEMSSNSAEHPLSIHNDINQFRDILAALCIMGGQMETLQVGSNVEVMPRLHTNELSYRGAKGMVVAYDVDKNVAEVVLHGNCSNLNTSEGFKSMIGTHPKSLNAMGLLNNSPTMVRPIRVSADDLCCVSEVEIYTNDFSNVVLEIYLTENIPYFIQISQSSLQQNTVFATDDCPANSNEVEVSEQDVDHDMSCDEDNEEAPIELGTQSSSSEFKPKEDGDKVNQYKQHEMTQMFIAMYGLRAFSTILKHPPHLTSFLKQSRQHLKTLFEISINPTASSGLFDLTCLEEKWVGLYSKYMAILSNKSNPNNDTDGADPANADLSGSAKSNNANDGNSNEAIQPPSIMCIQMMEMGFPREWCEIALNKCNQNVEAAINFCFEHSQDMDRFVSQAKSSDRTSVSTHGNSRSSEAADEIAHPYIEQLSEMGFPLNWCKKALLASRNNVDAALTWILSNGEQLEADDRHDEEVATAAATAASSSTSTSTTTSASADDPTASGPSGDFASVGPNPLRTVSGSASIGEQDMLVEGLAGGGFASVGAPDCIVTSGRWYYEATLHTSGCIQIGWADAAFSGASERGDGVGDGIHSWAYDGWRQQKWHGFSCHYGAKWRQGDVISCLVDMDAKIIMFALNGKMKSIGMGIAFRDIKASGGVYPCASFNRREKLQFNLGNQPFKYPPPPGFQPILSKIFNPEHCIAGALNFEKGSYEDCLEESVGIEKYQVENRYFPKDVSLLGKGGSSSNVESARSSNGSIHLTRQDIMQDLKQLHSISEIAQQLYDMTRTLSILYARRSLLIIIAKWPHNHIGPFPLEYLQGPISDSPIPSVGTPSQTEFSKLLSNSALQQTEANRQNLFLTFLKLVAGFNGSTLNGMVLETSTSSNSDEILDDDINQLNHGGVTSRPLLFLMTPVAKSILSHAFEHYPYFVLCMLTFLRSQLKQASNRLYSRIPWEMNDVMIRQHFLSVLSDAKDPQCNHSSNSNKNTLRLQHTHWMDQDSLDCPNLFLAEWWTRLMMDCPMQHGSSVYWHLRQELIQIWCVCLQSPSMTIKEKSAKVLANILQDMIVFHDYNANVDANILEQYHQVLKNFNISRLYAFCIDCIANESVHLPICSKFVQNVIELCSSICLMQNKCTNISVNVKNMTTSTSTAAQLQQIDACEKLRRDLFKINSEQMKIGLEEYLSKTSKQLQDVTQSTNSSTEMDESVASSSEANDGNNPVVTSNEVQDTNMEDTGSNHEDYDLHDSEFLPDMTLSAIANMVSEDGDVVAAIAAAAAAAANSGSHSGNASDNFTSSTNALNAINRRVLNRRQLRQFLPTATPGSSINLLHQQKDDSEVNLLKNNVSTYEKTANDFVYPKKEIEYDTTLLNESLQLQLKAASMGITKKHSVLDCQGISLQRLQSRTAKTTICEKQTTDWPYGYDLGVLSDTSASLFSGMITQYKVRLPTPKVTGTVSSETGEGIGESNSANTPPAIQKGSHVIRGRDWKWRDQDGGENSIGVVESIAPWSNVQGEGLSVRWPNDSVYTYRFGADNKYDLTLVLLNEDGSIKLKYPTPEKHSASDDNAAHNHAFGNELHFGVLIHLYEVSNTDTIPHFSTSSTESDHGIKRRLCGIMELSDYNAAIEIVGVENNDHSLILQEVQMLRGNPDMGWFSRFNCERYQPGTIYTLYPKLCNNVLEKEMDEDDTYSLENKCYFGKFHHSVRYHENQIVTVTGDIRLSNSVLFTMDPYHHFHTLKISNFGRTVTCTSGESRNLALGTVGFNTGIHYWEVRIDQAEFGSVFIGVCEKSNINSSSNSNYAGNNVVSNTRLNRWHGYGFVNFRATYHNSTERIYGDHFNAGDTIGVKLDMEKGALSFFMDGIKYGEHIVADLGVAFDSLQDTSAQNKTFYPCIGMRKTGDKVTINSKWVSMPTIPHHLKMQNALDVGISIHHWYMNYLQMLPSSSVSGHQVITNESNTPRHLTADNSSTMTSSNNSKSTTTGFELPVSLLRESWYVYQRWHENRYIRYPVRPRGVTIDFDTSIATCMKVSQLAELQQPLLANDRVRISSQSGRALDQPEEAIILGAYRNHLWYKTESQGSEGGEEGRGWAWYWTYDELKELILLKRNNIDVSNDLSIQETVQNDEVNDAIDPIEQKAILDFSTFKRIGLEYHHAVSDMQLVERINSICSGLGVDVLNVKCSELKTQEEWSAVHSKSSKPANATSTTTILPLNAPDVAYFSHLNQMKGYQLRIRFMILRTFNIKLMHYLPYVEFHTNQSIILSTSNDTRSTSVGKATTGTQRGGANMKNLLCGISSSIKLAQLRRLIFTSVKLHFWEQTLRATTTPTPLPSDEYEDPREIRIIRINRIQAQPSKLVLLPQPSDRLRKSVFGQLYREMRTWNDSFFRRAYTGKGHGGQKRAFKVKFLGEGVNDYGGPYRAVFEQIVDELQMDNVEITKGEQGLLPLLVPCPNRRSGTGSNQDKFLLNPSCGTFSNTNNGPIALELHRFLGKIIGTAVRHGLQIGLDLPSLVWRPLANLPVNKNHLEAIDVVSMNTLNRLVSSDSDANLSENFSDDSNSATLQQELTFTTHLSDGTEVNLIPNGSQVRVDVNPTGDANANTSLQHYYNLIVSKRLTESTPQLMALKEGLSAVLPIELFTLFTPLELEVLICGKQAVDIDLLMQCTEYEEVTNTTPHVEYFWQVLKEMNNDERTLFLRFVWARSRMPNSAKDFPMNFKIQAAHDQGARQSPDLYLPHAQTCFFSLSLPAYSSKEVLREKLLYAIQNSPNMDADVRLHNAEGWADA